MNDDLEIEEIEIIKEVFDEKRKIIGYAPREMTAVADDNCKGGDIFITEKNELIVLDYQMTDFDEVELVNYIELAEKLFERNGVSISIYIICPKTINITVPECSIKSTANFTIKLASMQPNPAYESLYRIKEKINRKIKLTDEDLETLSRIPMEVAEKDKRNLRIECLRLLKESEMY
jgi:hypothetical protein